MLDSQQVRRLGFAAALAVLCSAAPAWAQGTDEIVGTVIDAATKQPIADVVITATSPNLQGEQVVVTDSAGKYNVPHLPSGVYTLLMQKDGYKPYNRHGLRLRKKLTVDVQLLPQAIGAKEKAPAKEAPPEKPSGAKTP